MLVMVAAMNNQYSCLACKTIIPSDKLTCQQDACIQQCYKEIEARHKEEEYE